jgi:hypothetical protein
MLLKWGGGAAVPAASVGVAPTGTARETRALLKIN